MIAKRFDETGQNTMSVNDFDAIHIADKKGKKTVGYNIRSAVDNSSKCFVQYLFKIKQMIMGYFLKYSPN